MRIGKVYVSIAGGTELESGHVRMKHGAEYSIDVVNDFDQPANAEIKIDGKLAGTWRIQAHGQIGIERPANAERKFTFYRSGSSEAEKLDSVHPTVSGVVSVRVVPGKTVLCVLPSPIFRGGNESYSFGDGMKGYSGQTGLGAASFQRFGTAREIDLDYDRAVTVNLRIVCEENGPAPLHDVRSNAVPEAV